MPTPINDTINQLFSGNRVFVIPTFQRPYAWEQEQWEDLRDDIQSAVLRPHPFHYFAPIHVVPINNRQQPIWLDYRDDMNEDLIKLEASNFRDINGGVETLMVIDGQQRLITLYALLCAARGAPLVITLPDGSEIPRVILNPFYDHTYFRALLWPANHPMPPQVSRSQGRLKRLFDFVGAYAQPLFSMNNREYEFLTGPDCKTLLVELPAGPQLSSFMTLNDRGKDLSLLEKTKSLLMGFDADGPHPSPVAINTAFGAVHLSLDRNASYLTDDQFLQQFGVAVWGCEQNQVHQEGVQSIYENRFRNPASNFPGLNIVQAVHQELLPRLIQVTADHNHLADRLDAVAQGHALNANSFVNALNVGIQRDAIEDYNAVLNDLKLTAKQIAFLFQVRDRLGLNWHDSLGIVTLSNSVIIKALDDELLKIYQDIQQIGEGDDAARLTEVHAAITQNIRGMPGQEQREVTALQLADLLRIIVGDAMPGGYAAAWQLTFCPMPAPNAQQCANVWLNYITGYASRDRFILRILHDPNVQNNTFWLRYFLMEYECSLTRNAAARHQPGWHIEHYFPVNPGFDIAVAGFNSELDYSQNFIERVANKLILNEEMNKAIRNLDPLLKRQPYQAHAYGNVVAPPQQWSCSAIEIANDLTGITSLNAIRLYIRLRAVRLAAFAAKRF